MRIELGFQANCSELVTHIGLTKREDIVKAMAEIARITGWNWWIDTNGDEYLPVQIPQLDELVSISSDELGVDGDKILEMWQDSLDEQIKKTIMEDADLVKYQNDDYLEFAKKNKLPPEEISKHILEKDLYHLILVGDKDQDRLPGDPFDYRLGADITCNCPRKGLVFSSWDYYMEPLPAFHAIRTALGGDLDGCEGGGTHDYVEWMIYHFMDRKRALEMVGGEKPEEDALKKLERLDRYPPLDKSRKPSPKDIELVLEYLAYLDSSDLLTHVGITDRNQAAWALVNIANVTGRIWWAEIHYDDKYIPIPTAELADMVAFGPNGIGVDREKVRRMQRGKTKDTLTDPVQEKEVAPLMLWEKMAPTDYVKRVPWHAPHAMWSVAGLTFAQSHLGVPSYPAFHAIRMEYDGDCATDLKGTTLHYMKWLGHHFYERMATPDRLTDWATLTVETHMVDLFDRYLPIDKAIGLFEKDMEHVKGAVEDHRTQVGLTKHANKD